MCGIFGYIGKNNKAANIVLEGLKTLEYRGYDSWGIAVVNSRPKADQPLVEKLESEKIIIKKKIGEIGNAIVDELIPSNFAFGHTRWATHGGITEINAHPHLDCTGQFALIHNGIIENYDELKKELLALGHKFISQTDSEVAIHLIEENFNRLKSEIPASPAGRRNPCPTSHGRSPGGRAKSKIKEILLDAVKISFQKFTGLNAIIVMDARNKVLIAAKNGSPLVIGKGKDGNFLASDGHALLDYTRNVFFMEDNQMVILSDKTIDAIDLKSGRKKTITLTHLNWHNISTQKGNFAHFMLKEIYDQPKVLQEIISEGKSQVKDIAKQIKYSYGTYFVGCGTASYACLAGTYLFSKIAGRHVNFAAGSEFGYLTDFLTKKSLVLALSQSGETIDVIEAVKNAKEKGAQIGSLVNVRGSTLYRMSDFKLLLEAGTEKAVVSSKAFTAKLAYLILLAYDLRGDIEVGQSTIEKSISVLQSILESKYIERIKTLALQLIQKEHIYIIGRGLSYPIALETALKIKEASYIHAEGFAGGELKHGVIALIEKGTPCIAFLPADETYGANLAGAMELKARGGFIIGISPKPHEIFDYYFPVPNCEIAWIIPAVVVGQLLGYYFSVERGLNPDKPRNLAKSVTVK